MIPEIGHFVLILALCLSMLQVILPFVGVILKKESWMQTARPLALGQCFFITLGLMCLAYAFISDDFSVAYVAHHSNASLPSIYKLSAIWGGHEGSLLLWIWFLSGWTVSVSLSSRKLCRQSLGIKDVKHRDHDNSSLPFFTNVLAILGIINVGFILLLLLTSNPLQRLLPNFPIDGRDLNPLLQDPGLIIHPPLLYMGYVGFSIPFAYAMSALLLEQTNIPWAKWLRPWVLVAFGFLTLGIMLGSWWAYYELGWGGWWFWDPVENASFMPWLIGIALIHSLMATDKRGLFRGWTILLSILAFSFSLIGTFLVRSGILTSVHAFASDPKRGIFILQFLGLVIGGALLLYGLRGKKLLIESASSKIDLYSREALIFISALCLLVATLTILLGTVFPLIYDTFTGQKISVGFPYFNAVFIPLMLPVLIFIPLGPLTHWGQNAMSVVLAKLQWIGFISIASAILVPWFITQTNTISVIVGLSVGFWVFLGTVKSAFLKIKKRGGIGGLTLGAWGMILAHMGIAVMVIGITLVSNYHIERTVRMEPGQSLNIAGRDVVFQTLERIEGPNYIGYRGHFKVSENNQKFVDLFPEKRTYVVQGSSMSETAIDPGVFRDIYIALGEKLDKLAWSARIYYKPFVRWIWFGAIMMAVGSLLAARGRGNKG